MIKKIIIALFILVLLAGAAIVYLNNVFLPKKVKSLIISGIQEQTQKKVSLESVKINILKGLVLKRLVIYDAQETFLAVPEVDCTVLILPVFKKKIIIPTVTLNAPVFSLVRRADNSLNLSELFGATKSAPQENAGFSFVFYWVKISHGTIRLQDNTLSEPFSKSLQNVDANMYLSLPANIKFNVKAVDSAATGMALNCAGEYRIPEQQLVAKAMVQNFTPREFAAYYRRSKVNIPSGAVNALFSLQYSGGAVVVDGDFQPRDLVMIGDAVSVHLNLSARAHLQYTLADNQYVFSGTATLNDSSVEGMEFIGPITNIIGDVNFNNSGFYSDSLKAVMWGVPVETKASFVNFSDPLLNLHIFSTLPLVTAQSLLKDKMNFTVPVEFQGLGKVYVGIQTKIPSAGTFQVHGWLDFYDGIAKIKRIPLPLEEISGRLEFEANQVKWESLRFTHQGIPYDTKCIITDFKAPGVQCEVSSKDFSLKSIFAVHNKVIALSKCEGTYLDSAFSVSGQINAQDPDNPEGDLSGVAEFDLQDLKELFIKHWKQFETVRPEGRLHGQFSIIGNLSQVQSCTIEARFAGSTISLFGLKGKDVFITASQEEGMIDFPLIRASLYDGVLTASAKVNLKEKNIPFWVSADMKDIKVEKLKLDTVAKDKDVAGTLNAQVRIDTAFNDPDAFSGSGKIFITQGKLWQLNLFQGLGSLLFTKDFANIIFREGNCAFVIKDKYISTDKLVLKSDIVNLTGPVKLGFDDSVSAKLDVEVVSEMVPLTGTFRDVTTAIVGKAGRFGVIEVSGMRRDPKYKFVTGVGDFLRGIKNSIFQ